MNMYEEKVEIGVKLSFRILDWEEEKPYQLLLMADPSKAIVDEYLSRGVCFIAEYEGEMVGEFVLLKTRPETVEIVNIAVQEELQGQGVGKHMIKEAIEAARRLGGRTVEIGTGNSSFHQLKLYQRCGFRIVGVDRDFFVKHYEEEIIEDGIRCVDMIRLSLDLDTVAEENKK
ncbi:MULTISPECIES: GNAT family N-acetyltransferase [Paenibacillus]|uniref:GNAT family N-acetyltransferase n=2 Tax=Paenibacillus TaxID=44249 RepID=UPI0007FBE8AB|nr:putative N-acetyltransferase YvbK [Paenibacillus sp. AD87]SDL85718.1 Predicted acetyltransferase, GNAT superfamily [Paenibacillus sp. OK060]SEB12786.1 Predicted acetyltransferase, GNAT superfamily [Paenibacillus sp. 276b]SHN72469.1 Predicted acetyltransferase, GNAT superfamily [Paenibacillus sp. ov031]